MRIAALVFAVSMLLAFAGNASAIEKKSPVNSLDFEQFITDRDLWQP